MRTRLTVGASPLFAEDKKMGMNHGMLTASDFFICFRYPEGTFRQEELEELYVILYMNLVQLFILDLQI